MYTISKTPLLTLSFVVYLSHSEINISYPSKQKAFIRRNVSGTIDLAMVTLLVGDLEEGPNLSITDVVNLDTIESAYNKL